MKRSVIILLVIINSLSTALVAQDTAADKFKSGVEQYTAGNFEAAVDTWMKLYNEGYRSADLLYNIGNVNYKLKNIPGSILFYERALLLKPGSEDIRYNLQIARQSVVDKFTGIPDVFFVEWYNFASLSLRSDAWALVSITSFILLLFILAFFFFTSAYRIKVIAFWVAVFMAVLSISSFAFSSRNKHLVNNSKEAIIFTPVVNGKSSPDESGNDLFVLHEGSKVVVGDQVGEWTEVRLPDGNKGWIPLNSYEKI